MVSLRRKKFLANIEGVQRRSARLLALEEQKHEKAMHVVAPTNVEQATASGQSIGRKRGRKKKVREVYQDNQSPQEVEPNTNGSSSAPRNPTERTISYILDMLEVKDNHELFAMPDNIETYDYTACLNKPGDFATLRQKNKDGMYTTLDQFENDVYTVLGKAIDSNSPESVPYKAAVHIRDQAKHVFQSLKYNPTYAELELSAWHRRYFHHKKMAVRNDGNVGTSGCTSQPEPSSRPRIPSVAERGRPRRGSSRTRGKRAIESGHLESCQEPRRHTYRPMNESDKSMVRTVCGKHEKLIYNKDAMGYKDSVLHFVKDAGPAARIGAEKKCLEYTQRVQAQTIYDSWITNTSNRDLRFMSPFGSWSGHHIFGADTTNNRAQKPSYFPPIHSGHSHSTGSITHGATSASSVSMGPPSHGTAHDVLRTYPPEGPKCQLHTDELLTWFSMIGTPEFLKRSNNMASNSSQVSRGEQGSSSSHSVRGNQSSGTWLRSRVQGSSAGPEPYPGFVTRAASSVNLSSCEQASCSHQYKPSS